MTTNEAAAILADMIQVTGDGEVVSVLCQNRTITWEMKNGQCFKAVLSSLPCAVVVTADDE